ncbi:MAG TPA: heterodisulfide reductase subunit B [Candidatus Methanoperedenaceae archaeon]|nr:heterodisulfide reductase subunit B [Candidatus Methanoperedenaceae archaeon]
MKFSYYPGCTLHGSASEYDISTRAVCRALGIELVEIEDWNCCGALEGSSNKALSTALSARNIVIASKTSLQLVMPCSICSHNLARADVSIREDSRLRQSVEQALGTSYTGVRMKHLLDVMVNEFGLENLKGRVTRPLTGIKAAPYYGCLLVRPSKICRFDNPKNPVTMDNLIRALGADSPQFRHKVKCCGGSLLMGKEDIAHNLSLNILSEAKAAGADCLVAACPMCHTMLDGQQGMIEKHHDVKLDMPVVYFTQLIGIALGLGEKELGLDRNMVSASRLLDSICKKQQDEKMQEKREKQDTGNTDGDMGHPGGHAGGMGK